VGRSGSTNRECWPFDYAVGPAPIAPLRVVFIAGAASGRRVPRVFFPALGESVGLVRALELMSACGCFDAAEWR